MKNVIAQSPGRINIIGEHTDYNDGFVLPAAIDKTSIFQLKENGTESKVTITAANLNQTYSFDLTSFKPIKNGWENYVMGVVHELQQLGGQIKGFEGEFEGTVPIGGGMSSSAALECSLAFALNELFDLKLDKWQLIKASQMAEHNFVGIKCGIMDQFASMMGKKGQVMLLDCRSLDYEYFPLDLGDYELLLINTKVSHNLASSEYNKRRSECEEGVALIKEKYPTIQNLRDVSIEMLFPLADFLAQSIFKRCHHVVSENQRVLEATRALKEGNIEQLGQLLYQSHHSLQKDYEVSCVELDFLVEQTLKKEQILGSRMMGGGFGGCTINIIDKAFKPQFVEETAVAYREQFGVDMEYYAISVEDGSKLIL